MEVKIRVRPLTTAIGAVIEGVDLRQPLEPAIIADIRRAWVEHGVIFLPGQPLDRDQFYAFGACFSPPVPETFLDVFADRKLDPISKSSLTPTRKSTAVWHSDTTFSRTPPRHLLAEHVRRLRRPVRAVARLTAAHSVKPVLRTLGAFGDELRAYYARPEVATEHQQPVVRIHPETGRRALFVNEAWTTRINKLEPAESPNLLRFLFDHVKSPEFAMRWRWRWREHDLALWDNRCVQHFAVPDYTEERVIQRTYLAGDAPFGPQQARVTST